MTSHPKLREVIRAIRKQDADLEWCKKALRLVIKHTKHYELPNEIARDALNKVEK